MKNLVKNRTEPNRAHPYSEYQAKEENMKGYLGRNRELMSQFTEVKVKGYHESKIVKLIILPKWCNSIGWPHHY